MTAGGMKREGGTLCQLFDMRREGRLRRRKRKRESRTVGPWEGLNLDSYCVREKVGIEKVKVLSLVHQSYIRLSTIVSIV